MNTNESNAQIFESVKKSLTQNQKCLSPEDLEVVKCVFAALIVSAANSSFNKSFSSVYYLLAVANKLGLLEKDFSFDFSTYASELKDRRHRLF